MAHQWQFGVPDDGWAVVLLAEKDAEPLRATVMETVEPLAVLGLDVELVRRYVVVARTEIRVALRANGIVEYGEERSPSGCTRLKTSRA